MRYRWLVLALSAILFSPLSARAQQSARPKIVILTTGGTIASRIGAPMSEGDSLVFAVPQLLEFANIRVEEFSRIGSSQMTPAHWLRLAKRINDLFSEDHTLAGIVITHGTDTMEETAFFLNLTVQDRRPVVLVGSMRSANEISADGPANLLNAARVAVSQQSQGMGVLVVLNEEISAARDVWKTENRRVSTFRSPELGFLGFADPDTVIFYRAPLRPHTWQTEFELASIDSLPNVEIAVDYAGFDGSTVDYLVERRVDGIVLTTFAGGRMSAGARRAVARAGDADVPLVIASRVPGGRIVGDPLGNLQAVLARDLPAHKARILLMLALTRTREIEDIQRIFDTY